MRVTVCVATFGHVGWREQGLAASEAAEEYGAHEVLAYHTYTSTLAQARNLLAAQATGEWLLFLDADDRLDPGYLAAMEQAAMDKLRWTRLEDGLGAPVAKVQEYALLAPALRTVDEHARPCPAFPYAQLPNRHQPIDVLNHCVIGTLVQRDLFHVVGGFKEEPVYEDWALWLRCIRAGARVVDVPAAVYVATVRREGRNAAHDEVTYRSIQDEHRRLSGPA